ncbi:zinc finger protein 737-like [Wyeomyia smithii]|uniref:zinc finger protein 737-like n=1 Tax=Wyeomyia smithii TaxID=174621 RepID=UPI002467DD10|nr:zinc finger protein 737-like [Wyeomyia smithii]
MPTVRKSNIGRSSRSARNSAIHRAKQNLKKQVTEANKQSDLKRNELVYIKLPPAKCTICYQGASNLTPIECGTNHELCDRCLLDLLTRDLDSDVADCTSDIKESILETRVKKEPTELDYGSENDDDSGHHHADDFDTEFSAGPSKVELIEPEPEETPVKVSQERLPFGCRYCGERAATRKRLGRHIAAKHPKEKLHRCHICIKFFKGGANFKEHLRSVHEGFTRACEFCLEGYQQGEITAHRQICKGRLLFKCTICELGFVLKESLWKHLDGHEVPDESKDISYQETRIKKKLFTCVLCDNGLAFEEKSYLKHVHHDHGGYYLKCQDCGKTFRDRSHLAVHTREHCKVGEKARKYTAEHREPAKEAECQQCSKRFPSAARLYSHITRIHKALPVVCDICGHSSLNRNRLQYHKIKAHTEPTEKCPQCPKVFHLVGDLKQHLITHETEGEFVCAECGEMFKRKLGLDVHTRSHQQNPNSGRRGKRGDGSGSFRCDSCDRSFKHNYLLVAHKETHNPERQQFSCEECGKKFATKAGVYYHTKQKFVHQQMACTVCNVLVKGRERYAEHLLLHSQGVTT